MKNDFMDLLHGERDGPWTVEKLAAGIYASRCHVNMVLRNAAVAGKAGYGKQTRPKLVQFFKGHFTAWRAMLAALGWDENGNVIPHGTL